MRDLATKVDSSSSLSASEFNSFINELENLATRAGITLDAAAGPDNDLFMLARSVLIHAQAGMSYQDGGAANSFVLSTIQANFNQPTAYVDGMTVRFKAAATNTGACTINVSGLGAISFTKAGGGAYAAGEIVAGNIITATFFNGTNRFEEVSNTTPEASGPAAPDQVAVYADSGSASTHTLTIEPGYIQPSAFTDQMVILFKANATNNGAGTHPVNITGLGAKDLVEIDGTDPIAGRISADAWVMAVFREVRDELEIAFVTERPKPDTIFSGVTGASSNVFYAVTSLTESRPPTEYVDGMTVVFRAPLTNGGSVDMEIDNLGQRDLRNLSGSNFAAGEIPVGAMITAQFEAANNRFRASVVPTAPVNPLSVDRGAKIAGPAITNIAAETPQTLDFTTAPLSDPLGFYSAANDTFVGVDGVEAVDIQLNVQGSFQSGEDNSSYTAEIQVNGVNVGSASTRFSQGVEHVSITALDVPISQGQVVNAILNKSGSATLTLSGGTSMTIRASRFAT